MLSQCNIHADLVPSHVSIHRVHVLKVFRFFHAVYVIPDGEPLAHEGFVQDDGLQISHQVEGHARVKTFVVKPSGQAAGKSYSFLFILVSKQISSPFPQLGVSKPLWENGKLQQLSVGTLPAVIYASHWGEVKIGTGRQARRTRVEMDGGVVPGRHIWL